MNDGRLNGSHRARQPFPGSLERLARHRYLADAASVLVLLGLSLLLTRLLFHWNDSVLASDLSGAWAWFYWLKESIFAFRQLPTWSPLWMGGMPFFGIVPPAGFLLAVPLYLVTGDIPGAYHLGIIIAFSLSGLSMYLYLKHLSQSALISFLGAVLYLTLPVHMTSMMFWGHFEILCAYALIPLVLLFTDRWLDGRGQVNLVLLSLAAALALLLQIEYALILLLFYASYLAFALAVRRIWPRSLLALVWKGKAAAVIGLLILLVPFCFYLIVLTQYGHFSSLTPEQVEGGLSIYTLRHFGDPFQDRLAGGLEGYFSTPTADYYCGGLSFVIILGAMAAAIVERGRARAHLLFFLVAAMISLVLSMGIFGPLFPILRKVIPFLSGMRVPTRFYYMFALCLPALFALAVRTLRGPLARPSGAMPPWRRALMSGLPVLLVAGLLLDLAPYFDFYHHRILDREDYDRVCTFLRERIAGDGPAAQGIARVLVLPDGMEPDRLAALERYDDGGQFAIEVSQSWLTWDQYEDAFRYDTTVYDRVLRDAESLEFSCDLLSYDYIMTYVHNMPPPSTDAMYLELTGKMAETISSFRHEAGGPLLHEGTLETPYYTVNLYRLNRDVLAEARFQSASGTLFIEDDDLYASNTLLDIYRGISPEVRSDAFLRNVVAVAPGGEIPGTGSANMGAVRVCRYGGQVMLLADDPLAVQVLDAGAAETNGWTDFARKGSLGSPASGQDRCIRDAAAVEDNYLRLPFTIENPGDWLLSIEYFADRDTGQLEVLVDGQRQGSFYTFGYRPSVRDLSLSLRLEAGQHELRIIGHASPLTLDASGQGRWVEVGRISLLDREQMPRLRSESRDLWSRVTEAARGNSESGPISGLRLSPRGITLDIEAAEDGLLYLAYYSNPWWRAYVDGQETELIRVNGIFPGCAIARGQHHVELVYDYPALTNISHFTRR